MGISVYARSEILYDAPPLLLLLINSLSNVIVLLPFLIFDRSVVPAMFKIPPRTWAFVVLSLLFALLANFLIFSSIRILGASKASTFEIAYPFFVMLFTYLAFGSAPRRWLLIGGALIFAGATLIISYG